LSPEAIVEIRTLLEAVVTLADQAFSRAAPKRTDADVALRTAVLGLFGWGICEGYCVVEALKSKTPQGVAPIVRSLLEALITALYLADTAVSSAERSARLDRYFRGVRREQVRLRSALDDYPTLKAVFLPDTGLADREREEYRQREEASSPEHRLGRAHWSGVPDGLKGMAEDVGLGSDYAVQYRIHSGSTHGNRPWDQARFDPDGLLIIPSLATNASMGIPLGFDTARYLAWLLIIGFDCGAIPLEAAEVEQLNQYRKYAQSMEALHEQGIVGPSGTVS